MTYEQQALLYLVRLGIGNGTESGFDFAGVVALNILGLSTQVPMVYCYLTMGSARTIKFDGFKVILKRGVPRNFAYKTRLIALLVQAQTAQIASSIVRSLKIVAKFLGRSCNY